MLETVVTGAYICCMWMLVLWEAFLETGELWTSYCKPWILACNMSVQIENNCFMDIVIVVFEVWKIIWKHCLLTSTTHFFFFQLKTRVRINVLKFQEFELPESACLLLYKYPVQFSSIYYMVIVTEFISMSFLCCKLHSFWLA